MYAIERGAVVDVHAAARLGLVERLRQLISGTPALVHERGGDGQTPLHFASTVEIAGTCWITALKSMPWISITNLRLPNTWCATVNTLHAT